MSEDLYNYGTQDPIHFKITLSNVGQASLTLQAADIKFRKCTDADPNPTAVNIGTTNITDMGDGLYYWTPAAADTQCKTIIINIKDDSAGGAFDENCVILSTGNNPSARF